MLKGETSDCKIACTTEDPFPELSGPGGVRMATTYSSAPAAVSRGVITVGGGVAQSPPRPPRPRAL